MSQSPHGAVSQTIRPLTLQPQPTRCLFNSIPPTQPTINMVFDQCQVLTSASNSICWLSSSALYAVSSSLSRSKATRACSYSRCSAHRDTLSRCSARERFGSAAESTESAWAGVVVEDDDRVSTSRRLGSGGSLSVNHRGCCCCLFDCCCCWRFLCWWCWRWLLSSGELLLTEGGAGGARPSNRTGEEIVPVECQRV